MKKSKITELYRKWRKEHNNKKPNRVEIAYHWEDDTDVKNIGIIALKPFDINVKDDDDILFYCSSLKELFELKNPNNGSDFIVDEVYSFFSMKFISLVRNSQEVVMNMFN